MILIAVITARKRSFHGCLPVHGGGGSCPGGSLSGRLSRTVTCGRYASYWNAFLFGRYFIKIINSYKCIVFKKQESTSLKYIHEIYCTINKTILHQKHSVSTLYNMYNVYSTRRQHFNLINCYHCNSSKSTCHNLIDFHECQSLSSFFLCNF